MEFPLRINKYLADRKIASRREADALIESGKVLVNGVPAMLGQKINAGDTVTVTGSDKKYRYIAYNKPRGVISHSPASGEEDIETRLRKDHNIKDVYPVGRLDKDSEGLIILTNDGRITKQLLEPGAEQEKEYLVGVDKKISEQFLKHMRSGVDIEGYRTKPAQTKSQGEKQFTIVLTEGKKHQIRRMCAALGYQVNHLTRLRVANIILGKLSAGQFRDITGDERQAFLSQLGIKS